jgi:hypothetical protein
MTKIKALSAAVLLLAAIAAPVFAQAGNALGNSYGWEPNSSANNEKPRLNSRIDNSENFGTRNSEMAEPGDFAVTGGEPSRSRAWNPTGQVDPGTSNSPAGNAGGE